MAAPTHEEALFRYLLRLADTAHILSHRLGEWCGHGPIIEEDIALTNVALDLIGQARLFYQYAAEVEGKGRSEDDLAFLRAERDMNNLLLVEQPNGDYAVTIARQFLFDAFNLRLMQALVNSTDTRIAEIAAKAVKEVAYHRRHSASWVVRLGDGTDESHDRIAKAFAELYGFTGEFFEMDGIDRQMAEAGVGPDLGSLREDWEADIRGVLAEATLDWPDQGWTVIGGRHEGKHTEHLGYLLSEMSFMQRTYPGMTW
ncbi:MAG: 1,2-phenylacetyl-CoA epoxidase subunit PaaC [Minwuia sp.]|uniref:1,2-phenylacetyl-CoA epoxidase subunit PaaC n=1 Tax=Minwuia sp. TaxID=2493630 RepID=UPI003A8A66D4